MSINCLAAQAFIFFAAGFDTSSTTMTFCLYELAVNPDIQEALRNEIDTVLEKHGGNISYEAIQEMTYLDKVVAGKNMVTLISNVIFFWNYRIIKLFIS
jgi:cytochrome P450 family 6